MTLETSNGRNKFEVKRSHVRVIVTGNENAKIVFVYIFVKNRSIYVKPSPK